MSQQHYTPEQKAKVRERLARAGSRTISDHALGRFMRAHQQTSPLAPLAIDASAQPGDVATTPKEPT